MVPVLDEVAQSLGSAVRVLKFDTDDHPDMAEMFRVQGLPTLLFLGAGSNGQPKVRPERGVLSFHGSMLLAYYVAAACRCSRSRSPPQVLHRFEGAAPKEYVLDMANHFFNGGPKPRDVRQMMQ